MPFVAFHEFFPEVAKAETRTVTVRPGLGRPVPPADYGFLEMFCDEAGCDCRRVMFYVLSSARNDVEAVIAWGWEEADFYARWLGRDDPALVKELQGPVLNLGSPQTKYSEAVLQLAKEVLLTDPAYVERVKRHYAMFRDHIAGHEGSRTRGRAGSRPDDARGASQSSRARRRREWRRNRPDTRT